MAFVPKITATVSSCSKLTITDVTGLYSADNTTGWNNASTVQSADISAVKVYINDILYEDISDNFLNDIHPVVGTFEYDPIDYTLDDGIAEIKLIYEVAQGLDVVSYQATMEIVSFAKSQCCIDKAWLKYVKGEDFCDKESLEQLRVMDGLLYGAIAAASCMKRVEIDTILAKVTKFCEFKNCKC